ncbi:glycosyltransferase family 4 protein [Streptomyces sp. CA-251387]|uniref:glycosyltransferase family 4 protein n=1 Tax=Streptomyces sp. CA-251387 TaxID=3240064 RepID=UPI003D8C99A3
MTPRTVLFAAPYFSANLGTVERYVWHLARLLQSRHGHRVVVATPAARGTEAGRFDGPEGIPVYRIAAPVRASHTPLGLHWRRSLRSIVEEEQIELVNGHAPAPLFADAAARACGDVPFVLTCHAGRMHKGRLFPDVFCAGYERRVLARTVRRAHEVVCSSYSLAAELPHLFSGRSTMISPGVDLRRFTMSPVPQAPRIVFSASLEPAPAGSGLPTLLRAVRALTRTVPDVQLEVVGPASSTAEQEAQVRRLGLDGHVTFTRRLEWDELAAVYQRARVVALPAYDDFPSMVVEAMASGRPVVSTPVAGTSSLLVHGRNGLLTAPGDEAGLAKALGSVLGDDALAQRLGQAGREHVVRELTWEHQSDRAVEVFDRAADRSRGPVRTVAVVAPYYPPHVGGAENYAAFVARAVADDPAMRAVVITSNTAGLSTRVGVDDHDVPIVRLGTWTQRLVNAPLSPLWPLQLPRWLRRFAVDIVNAHGPVPGLGDLAVVVSGRRPTVMTYHCGTMVKGCRIRDRLLGWYERYILPRLFSRARAIVAVSPVSLAFGRPGAIEITPGVDVERFTPGPAASTRPRTILYVGRMDRASSWKGIDVLLRAFATLADVPDARLKLVGGGNALPSYAALADQLGIAGRVEFTGKIVGDALVAAVQSAAMLVLPSLTEAESFGMVLAEAMACGTPVVGSDVGGIPHVIKPGVTGLLVPPGDADALAATCRRLLYDGALADRLGAAGRRCAVEHHAWPILTDRYRQLFRSLLTESRSAETV